jgi:hypothetical protein
VSLPLLLGIAWLAFFAKTGVRYLPSRRRNDSLPGLPPLPSNSLLAERRAAYARPALGQPLARNNRRSRAAQRRFSVLVSLTVSTLVFGSLALITHAAIVNTLALVSIVALASFVTLLVRRKKMIEQARIERLWSNDRYDEVGQARVMSLEEARHRAERIAAPVYVAPRYRSDRVG